MCVATSRISPLCLSLMSSLLLANLGGIVSADDSKPGAWSITLERITQIQSPRLDSPKVTTESGTLVLGNDSYELRMPKTTDAYATKTKTLVTLDHTKKEHVSMPMHALVWFYNSETIHRNALCHATEAAQLSLEEMEPCSRFELESLFGYMHPQANKLFDQKAVLIDKKQIEGKLHFESEGKLAVTFEPSMIQLDNQHSRMFRRFLAHMCRMHPEIRHAVGELSILPSSMSFRTREGTTHKTIEYRFTNFEYRNEELHFEIPNDYKPQASVPRIESILNKLEMTQVPSSVDIYNKAVSDIDQYLANHRLEDAVLAAYRYFVLTDSDQGLRDLLTRCGGVADRKVRHVVYALENPREIKDLKLQLDSEKNSMAYLLDYYLADVAMAQHRNQEPINESLMKALEQDPLLVGAYVDLWRRLLEDWDPYTAWRCVQAARRISPNHSDLIPVNKMEKMIELDSPDFF